MVWFTKTYSGCAAVYLILMDADSIVSTAPAKAAARDQRLTNNPLGRPEGEGHKLAGLDSNWLP